MIQQVEESILSLMHGLSLRKVPTPGRKFEKDRHKDHPKDVVFSLFKKRMSIRVAGRLPQLIFFRSSPPTWRVWYRCITTRPVPCRPTRPTGTRRAQKPLCSAIKINAVARHPRTPDCLSISPPTDYRGAHSRGTGGSTAPPGNS